MRSPRRLLVPCRRPGVSLLSPSVTEAGTPTCVPVQGVRGSLPLPLPC